MIQHATGLQANGSFAFCSLNHEFPINNMGIIPLSTLWGFGGGGLLTEPATSTEPAQSRTSKAGSFIAPPARAKELIIIGNE